MKILHNKKTINHNIDSQYEGSYRIEKIKETVSDIQLNNYIDISHIFINKIHDNRYIKKILGACKSKSHLAEVQLTPESYIAMITSIALSIMAAENNSFAITRPPGHHASKNKAEGFCFFNNIAVATSYLLSKGKKVCIIDIDGHNGNGTQSIFQKEDNVMFASIYQDNIYPYSKSVNDEKNINIPLLEKSGDDVFLKSLKFIIERVKLFNPDHIAISAGFDGYFKDNLLSLNYSINSYYEAGKIISALNKPTFAVLEGGYHDNIKICIDALSLGLSKKKNNLKKQIFNNSSDKCNEYIDNKLKEITCLLEKK